jgi:hypothetical protein
VQKVISDPKVELDQQVSKECKETHLKEVQDLPVWVYQVLQVPQVLLVHHHKARQDRQVVADPKVLLDQQDQQVSKVILVLKDL